MQATSPSVRTLLFAQHGWADGNQAMHWLGTTLAHAPTGAESDTRVIAPDLGFVRTWLRIEPLIETVERVAEEALAEHPDARVRIVGHSMGGLIWIELLTRRPEWLVRVDRLALVGCPVGGAELAGMLDPLGLTIGRDLKVDRRARAEAVAAVVPTLAVVGDRFGTGDGTISHQSARFANARFVLVPAASHASSRYSPWVPRLLRAFFDEPSPPLVDLPALVARLEAIPGIRPASTRLFPLARARLMLADGSTIRWMPGLSGWQIVLVATGGGDCVYAGAVPGGSRAALQAAIAEIYEAHPTLFQEH